MPSTCQQLAISQSGIGEYVDPYQYSRVIIKLIIWQNPTDKSGSKRKLTYWVELAKLLEKGGISGLFLADTNGGFDIYGGSVEESIRKAVQWPVTDPAIVCSDFILSFCISSRY